MTLEDRFFETPYNLSKVCLTKGETMPLHTQKPLILFIRGEGFSLSLERETIKTHGREEIFFLPQGFPFLLSSENHSEIFLFSISDPLLLYFRHISHFFEKDNHLDSRPLDSLPIHPLILNFLSVALGYKNDHMLSDKLLEIKAAELFILFKQLYTEEQIKRLFTPVLSSGYQFKMTVLASYKKVKTVAELSDISGISISSFHRVFHKVFGVPPYKWMIQKKVESLSEAILHSSIPLKQIADEYGFHSTSKMIEFYHKHTGTTPGETRKKRQLGDMGY